MISPNEHPEREAIEGIAADFRERGYEVIVAPRGSALPEFLEGTTPDLIATRDDEHVVVEVRHSPSRVDPDQTRRIADRVSQRVGWRFVLLAPKPREQFLPGEEVRLLDGDAVLRRSDEARALAEAGHLEASLLLAWTAAEAAMRLAVGSAADDRPNAPTLLRRLASEGLLDQSTFAALNDAFRLRSAIAHGLMPARGDVRAQLSAAVESLLFVLQALLGDRRKLA